MAKIKGNKDEQIKGKKEWQRLLFTLVSGKYSCTCTIYLFTNDQ